MQRSGIQQTQTQRSSLAPVHVFFLPFFDLVVDEDEEVRVQQTFSTRRKPLFSFMHTVVTINTHCWSLNTQSSS